MNDRPVRPLRGLLMIPSYALYLGTAYWLESRGAPGPIILAVFAAHGVLCSMFLPAGFTPTTPTLTTKPDVPDPSLGAGGAWGGSWSRRSPSLRARSPSRSRLLSRSPRRRPASFLLVVTGLLVVEARG
jgi:hypothetical protein